MNTRIKKYQKLRDQIGRDIKNLTIKKEQQKKISIYEQQLKKIDSQIFQNAHDKALKSFPSLNSLINIEQKAKEEKNIEIANQATEVIELLNKEKSLINNNRGKKITELIPALENENIINNQLNNLTEDFKNLKKNFSYLIHEKEKLINASNKISDDKPIISKNIFKWAKDNEVKVENKLSELSKFNNKKKRETKFLLVGIVLSTIIVISILCVLLLTANANAN